MKEFHRTRHLRAMQTDQMDADEETVMLTNALVRSLLPQLEEFTVGQGISATMELMAMLIVAAEKLAPADEFIEVITSTLKSRTEKIAEVLNRQEGE